LGRHVLLSLLCLLLMLLLLLRLDLRLLLLLLSLGRFVRRLTRLARGLGVLAVSENLCGFEVKGETEGREERGREGMTSA
jgi:hypothetical protein